MLATASAMYSARDTADVSDAPVHPAVATAVGAVIAGVAGGTVSILAGSIYGIVVGIALAMPVFFQYGYGVGATFLGGGAVFLARTSEFQDGE